MTNEVKKLTDEQGKVLAQAYSEYKAAEARFLLLKDTICEPLDCGKHITNHCIVNKIPKTGTSVNYKQACEDAGLDLEPYTTVKEQKPTITVQPLTPKESKFTLFK